MWINTLVFIVGACMHPYRYVNMQVCMLLYTEPLWAKQLILHKRTLKRTIANLVVSLNDTTRHTRLTVEVTQRPVTTHVQGFSNQVKGKGSSIGTEIRVACCDVDGIGPWLFAHLYFRWKHVGGIVINVQQVDLQGSCPTGSRVTCKQKQEYQNITEHLPTFHCIRHIYWWHHALIHVH